MDQSPYQLTVDMQQGREISLAIGSHEDLGVVCYHSITQSSLTETVVVWTEMTHVKYAQPNVQHIEYTH